MNLKMNIDYSVSDTDKEIEELIAEIVGEEARGFVEALRRRLAVEGVVDISMNVSES